MPRNEDRKYTQTIDYLEDLVGADLNRDMLQVALSDQDLDVLDLNIQDIGGAAQSAVDVADAIDQIEDALTSTGTDQLRVDLENNNVGTFPTTIEGDDTGGTTAEVQADELDATLGGSETALITILAAALNDVGTDELVSRITDSTGAQIDPSLATDYPDNFAEQDLSGGDLVIGPVPVGRSQAVVVSGFSEDAANWEATVEWQSDSGDRIIRQTPSDVGLNGVTEDYSRLIRKGQQVQVTFSDTSGGTNNINAFVDAHR